MNPRTVFAFIALFLLLPARALPGPSELPSLDAPPADEEPVRARLMGTGEPFQPGTQVRVGVHLDQDPGWHTYWENGGDSGLATTIEWGLPAGWSASDILWPTPHRYVEAGDLTTFGYAGDIVLFTDLSVPKNAPTGPVTLKARVDWLMCRELCIPDGADIQLTVTVGGDARVLSDRDARLIQASALRLPVPASSVDDLRVRGIFDLNAVPAGQRAHAAIVVAGLDDAASVDWIWFPAAADPIYPDPPTSAVVGDELVVGQPFELDENVEPGITVPWRGILELELASGEHRFLDVALDLTVADEGQTVRAENEDLFAALLGVDVSAGGGLFDQDFSSAAGGGDRGLIYYLLLALVGGVILNVMPCVLPVLSLKVMSFVRHAGEDRGVQFRLGLTFAAGVLASFLALALVVVALQAAGDQLGWGFQFQNPMFVVVMGAVVFAFGLSLFGVYEIVLPIQMGGGGGGRGSAYAESFLNGILATALATPCTAPFLGTALGFAFTQPAVAILAIFLTIGVGLSLPYVILSLNPAWLRFVPKPGAWMDRFKQAMGFLLMATLIWLLWVLGQQVGIDGVVWTMAFLLTLGFALWLYGSLLDLSASTTRRVTVWLVMLALVGVGWSQLLSGRLDAEAVAAHASTNGGGHTDGDLVWRAFSVEELEEEVAAGNTVFVDFTAAWCTTCKVNEKTVLAADAVRERLRELNVVTFVGDWTNRDPVITKVLRQFGRSGVPFYAVFPANRLDAPIVLPEVITQGIVLEALDQAGPSQPVASR